jgi:hypothetical protein
MKPVFGMWAAVEALSLGHGGIASVARATGLSRTTIHSDVTELEPSEPEDFAIEAYGAVCCKGLGVNRLPTATPTCYSSLDSLASAVSDR